MKSFAWKPYALFALLAAVLVGLASSMARADDQTAAAKPAGRLHVYIGTYTSPKSQGLYLAELDLATGRLSEPTLAASAANCSFLNVDAKGTRLFAVNQEGNKQGGMLAYSIDGPTGKLTQVGEQASCGSGPCYVAVDRSGQCVLVASYGTGTVAALAIQKDGSLANAAEVIQQQDPSGTPNPRKPHAHSINVDLANRFAVAADLGLNELLVYRLDPEHAKLTPNDPPFTAVKSGSGPRHFAFHPGGKLAYACMEHTSEIIAFAYDADKGTLRELQTLSTLPEPVKGNSTAEIQVHPNGRFVYVSNRGHNSIAIFGVDPQSGQMTALGHQSTEGKVPRNFTIDPTAQYLLAANQDSNNIVVFRVDGQSGKLTPTGQSVEVGKPVCVKFVPVSAAK